MPLWLSVLVNDCSPHALAEVMLPCHPRADLELANSTIKLRTVMKCQDKSEIAHEILAKYTRSMHLEAHWMHGPEKPWKSDLL